jgi:hypothetical protein
VQSEVKKKPPKGKSKRPEEEIQKEADHNFVSWEYIKEWRDKEPQARVKELKEWVLEEIELYNKENPNDVLSEQEIEEYLTFGHAPVSPTTGHPDSTMTHVESGQNLTEFLFFAA